MLHLEILSDVEDSRNVEGVLLIKVAERGGQIGRVDLPNSHEDELVIGVAGEEHGQELAGIFVLSLIPWFL